MPIDPILIADSIKHRFTRYLRTAYAFPEAHGDLRRQFAAALDEPGRLFRGPYLHGLAPYARAESVNQLIAEGVLPAAIRGVPLLKSVDSPLYRHQVEAIRRIRAGHNAVVSSGTGSGKTLTFLAPIVAGILEKPAPGVHALLLYPMNALVNDQLKTLREKLGRHPSITFGRYINIKVTKETEKEARRNAPHCPPNEVVSREAFRAKPPHILITNYAMLEYLLLRKDDSPLFHGPWRYVVVDEAHTYSGTKGGEVALLLRRLVDRVKREGEPRPQFMATSASLGTKQPTQRAEILKFAETLFHAPFDDADLIAATPDIPPADGTATIDPSVYRHAALAEALPPRKVWTPELTAALAAAGFPRAAVAGAAALAAADPNGAIYEVFRHDARVSRLRAAAVEPCDLKAAAKAVIGRDDDTAVAELSGLVAACTFARVPGGDIHLVPCRYHSFVRGLDRAYVSLAPDGLGGSRVGLHLDPLRETPEGHRAYELHACRTCGEPHLRAWLTANGDALTPTKPGLDADDTRWFTWVLPQVATTDDEEIADVEESVDAYSLNAVTGAYAPDGGLRAEDTMRVWQLGDPKDPRKLSKCFACGGKDSVTAIKTDTEGAQAVVADSFYRCLEPATAGEAAHYPGGGRKLLAFSDNRQSAAYFAPYLEDTNRQQLMRHLVYDAVRTESASGPADLLGVADRMVRAARDRTLYPTDTVPSVVRKECELALVTQFAIPFGRRQTPEALALFAVEVALPRTWQPPETWRTWFHEAELRDVVQVLLASLRHATVIDLPGNLTTNELRIPRTVGVMAQGSAKLAGGCNVIGFAPARDNPRLQRRAAYLRRALDVAAERAEKAPPPDTAIAGLLDDLFQSLIAGKVLEHRQLAPAVKEYQLRWKDLRARTDAAWAVCSHCRQWSAFAAPRVCPNFRCTGTLTPADPDLALEGNHYRRICTHKDDRPIPLSAKEHTAQLGPDLATGYQAAFQDGHHDEHGQINVLSSSTTFELGVDLGDLEAVMLRNVPPGQANYQQRSGRAGRGAGTAAFAVTFAMPRSHDQHFYTHPPAMIAGAVRAPRADLRNETIYLRHLNAVLLAEFVHASKTPIERIGQLMPTGGPSPCDDFLACLPAALSRNARAVKLLIQDAALAADPTRLAANITELMTAARTRYASEIAEYDDAIAELRREELEHRAAGKTSSAIAIGLKAYEIERRLDEFRKVEWIEFLSNQCVLPSYAFPIHNVPLVTSDPTLKLERDLRLALSEYVPGASIVARGRTWKSVGLRKPFKGMLEARHYAQCPKCKHVMRSLQASNVFPDDPCPVCGDPGHHPKRMKHKYVVPEYGFTADLTEKGEDLDFTRPHRIPASKVLFIPQQTEGDAEALSVGGALASVRVRTTERADFFVFNDGDQDRQGFKLCEKCYRKVEFKLEGRGKDRKEKVQPHKTPAGRECSWRGYDKLHLGHEFKSSAARLNFLGAGKLFTDHAFWQSLLYALLGGMADALGIESHDINGVINPVPGPNGVAQEVVIFDDVPGGAGHALRLATHDELLAALRAAHERVATCVCGETASCYACLRSFRNQFLHDSLQRGPVADYLARLLQDVDAESDSVRPYPSADRAAAFRSAIRDGHRIDIVADGFDAGGPPAAAPWYVQWLEAAARPGTRVRLALRDAAGGPGPAPIHLASLAQAGVELRRVKPGMAPPAFGLLALGTGGDPGPRSVGFAWGAQATTAWNAETHRAGVRYMPSATALSAAGRESDAWFEAATEPLSLVELARADPACKVHPFRQGAAVALGPVFAGLQGQAVVRCRLQDPYLRTEHQMKAFSQFVSAVPWPTDAARGTIPLVVATHLAEGNPSDRNDLTPAEQRKQVELRAAAVPAVALAFRPAAQRYASIHMRYAHFELEQGERFYVLERGLDMIDPRTGRCRTDTYILEFETIPEGLKRVVHPSGSAY